MPTPPAAKVKWTVVVDPGTDLTLRRYLAAHGTRKGDISRFVEDAVRRRLLDLMEAEKQR